METTSGFIAQSCSFSRVHPTRQLTELRQSHPSPCGRAPRPRGLASGRTRWNDVEDLRRRRACLRGETGGGKTHTAAAVRVGRSATSCRQGSVYFIRVGFTASAVVETLATCVAFHYRKSSGSSCSTADARWTDRFTRR